MGKRLWAFIKRWVCFGSAPTTMTGWGLPWLWHRVSDASTIQTIWTWVGADEPMLVRVVTHPAFGLGLIIVGLLGIPAALKQTSNSAVKTASYIFGWGIFGAAWVLILSTVLFAQFSLTSGVVEAKNFYVERHAVRHLTTEQADGLTKFVCPILGQIGPLSIGSVDASEPRQYATEILHHLTGCGLKPFNPWAPGYENDVTAPFTPTTPSDLGVLITTADPGHPSERELVTLRAMTQAGFKIRFSKDFGYIPPAVFIGISNP